jgi:cytoskeleton protein RodZ
VIAEKEPAGLSMGVAALLRETRIKQGRDIALVATTLRIRQPYLQAIEDGRFQDLPGSAYAVGFVRGYAEYLGLDGPEIVRRFKQENSDLAGRAELVFPSATSGGGIPTGALLGLAVVGAVVAYGAWYFLQDRSEPVAEAVPPLPERLAALIHKPVEQDAPAAAPRQAASSESAAAPAPEQQQVAALPEPAPAPAPAPEPQAAQPEPAPAPAATAPDSAPAKALKQVRAKAEPPKAETPAVAGEPAPVGDNPSATASADGAAAVPAADAPKAEKVVWKTSKRVRIKATADCWVKVRDADGKVVVSRLLHAGDTFAPPGNPGLTMTVGNAGALTVVLDGRDLPPLGAEGVVKKVALDPQKLGGAADEPTETPSTAPQE